MLSIVTSNGVELLSGINIADLGWPWTPKMEVLVFFAIFGCEAHIKS